MKKCFLFTVRINGTYTKDLIENPEIEKFLKTTVYDQNLAKLTSEQIVEKLSIPNFVIFENVEDPTFQQVIWN